MNTPKPLLVAAISGLCLPLAAMGQSAQRAAFVANNGNVEGSVTSFTFSPTGVPQFVAKFITGGSGSPGTNAYSIALTPDGRHLATTHATAAAINEQVTIMRVNADATLTLVGTFLTPDSPLACTWLGNDLLAVTLTKLGGVANKVRVYRFVESAPSLTLIEAYDTGTFTGYLAATPDRRFLFAQDSPLGGPATLVGFRVNQDGTLTNIGTTFTSPHYALGPGISADGTRLYGGGGTSIGSNTIVGYFIDAASGALTPMPLMPFTSPNGTPSPKQVVESRDGRFAFVAHGSSSEVRSFSIDPLDGTLTDTTWSVDFGIQGDLGSIAVLGNWLLATKTYSSSSWPGTGLVSYTIQPSGTFLANADLTSTQGSLPRGIAPWDPPAAPSCYANCDASTIPPVLNVADFTCFLNSFTGGASYANCDQSTTPPVLNVADFNCFLNSFAGGEPYANCDASTIPPVLNVADFTCFLNQFASGCP